jgi:2-keto-4-pentenoate hydratase/2-oxohepta-3-ene-1,7-dioic acid hydratase in catechol pathway
MKLATFSHSGRARVGLVHDDQVLDLVAAEPELPTTLLELLAGGADALSLVKRAEARTGYRLALRDVQLQAPIPRPGKVLAIGVNYADHIAEMGREKPDHPTVFNKQSSCVNGPHAPIHLPRVSSALDYECELAFVIGRRCRHVPKARAREVIAGYCAMNDVTVRDWQVHTPTWTMGKSFDTHGPLGPWLTTADAVPDPHALGLRTFVNGEQRQNSNTRNLVFNCFDLVAYLSTAFTLEPGDVISTGTPSGVAAAMKPPRWLVAGDVVRVEIDQLGALENKVIPEPADSALI